MSHTKEAEPVFKRVLGEDWASLAPSVQAHYSLSPFTGQTLRLEGVMESVSRSRFGSLVMPFMKLFGALIPHTGENVPIEVINYSLPEKAGYYWERNFVFPGRGPSSFFSVTFPAGHGEVIEFVRFGMGIRMTVSARDGGIVMKSRGYVWKGGALTIPLPINLIVGEIYIEEMPISDSAFKMRMHIKNRLFGETFAYNGRFSIVKY